MEVQVLSFAPAHEVSTTFSPRCSKLQSDLELLGHGVDPRAVTQLDGRICLDAGKSSFVASHWVTMGHDVLAHTIE
jgi:hypothetical protein